MGAQDSRPEPRRSRGGDLQRYGNDDNGLFHCFTGKGADIPTPSRISYNNPNTKTGITCFAGPVDPGENRSKRSPLTPRQKRIREEIAWQGAGLQLLWRDEKAIDGVRWIPDTKF